jgi:hypothetical protein
MKLKNAHNLINNIFTKNILSKETKY